MVHGALRVKPHAKEVTPTVSKVDRCALLLLPMYANALLATFSRVSQRDNMAKKWKKKNRRVYERAELKEKHSKVQVHECVV